MTRRTHPDAVGFALEQEFFEKGEELFIDEDHRRGGVSRQKRYLGSVKSRNNTVHYWWVYADEAMMTIDDGGHVVSKNLENPLKRIPQKEMTVEELEQAGEFEIPPVMMREISYLSKMGASVMGPLEYRACDVLLPLLGIKIVPESDAELVRCEGIDWGIIRFYRPMRK